MADSHADFDSVSSIVFTADVSDKIFKNVDSYDISNHCIVVIGSHQTKFFLLDKRHLINVRAFIIAAYFH